MSHKTETEIIEIITRFLESGSTVRGYLKDNGLSSSTFYRWVDKYGFRELIAEQQRIIDSAKKK